MREVRDPDLRAFVVWEPVLLTDWHAPGKAVVARIPDARAVQFWDAPHALSKAIRSAAQSDPAAVLGEHRLHGSIIWDFVAVYPPSARWTGAFPAARFAGAPVVRVADDLRRALTPNSLQSFTPPTNWLYTRLLTWN